jgi:hypothetical protein
MRTAAAFSTSRWITCDLADMPGRRVASRSMLLYKEPDGSGRPDGKTVPSQAVLVPEQ